MLRRPPAGAAMDDQVVARRSRPRRRRRRGLRPSAASRSLSLTRNSPRPRMTVRASGKRGRHRQDRVLVDHARRARRPAPRRRVSAAPRDDEVGDRLAARPRLVLERDRGAHLGEAGIEAGPQRVEADALQADRRAGGQGCGHGRERRRGRIARHDEVLRRQLGLAGDRHPAAAARRSLDRRARRPCRPASARYGRARPGARPRWCAPARAGRPAGRPTSPGPRRPGSRRRSAADRCGR